MNEGEATMVIDPLTLIVIGLLAVCVVVLHFRILDLEKRMDKK
jgi:hypothetical protein